MTFGVSVKGGTGAGSKKPLLPANTIPWACKCVPSAIDEQKSVRAGAFTGMTVKLNPGYLRKCIDCGTQRP